MRKPRFIDRGFDTPTTERTTVNSASKPITRTQIAGRGIMITVIIIALAVIGVLGWQSWVLWQQLTAPVSKPTPYNESYQASAYPGKQFLKELAESVPDGIQQDKWVVSSEGKNDTSVRTLPAGCTQIAPSTAQLSYKTAKTDGLTVSILIYGAGQARTQFDKYAAQLVECKGASVNGNTAQANGGAIITNGDAIVSIVSDNNELVSKLLPWYQGRIAELLGNTGCAVLNESASDATRSFYYDANSYTGTMSTEKVAISEPVLNVSSPQLLTDNSMSVSRVFIDPKDTSNVKQPLSPLPSGMSTELPAGPSLPSVSAKPVAPVTEKTVSYQIVDKTGPGCGWAWSGQKTPVFNEKLIKANQRTALKNARVELQNNVNAYNKAVIDWSAQTALSMSFQSSWDSYVENVNNVYNSWNDLNNKRAAIQDQWFAYVDEANKWIRWSDDVSKAQKDWETEIKQCVNNSNTTGGSNSSNNGSSDTTGNTGDTTGNTTSPDNDNSTGSSSSQVQAECEKAHPKPEILTADRPSKPVAPTIPNGVTLPSTWPVDPLK